MEVEADLAHGQNALAVDEGQQALLDLRRITAGAVGVGAGSGGDEIVAGQEPRGGVQRGLVIGVGHRDQALEPRRPATVDEVVALEGEAGIIQVAVEVDVAGRIHARILPQTARRAQRRD